MDPSRVDERLTPTGTVRETREHLERLQETGRPEVLTVHGEAEVVVQDADAYQELLDRLERAEAVAGIREGLASMERGEGRTLEEAIDPDQATRRKRIRRPSARDRALAPRRAGCGEHGVSRRDRERRA